MLSNVLVVLETFLYLILNTNSCYTQTFYSSKKVVHSAEERIDNFLQDLVIRWAPLIYLAPGEEFFPGSVSSFLEHVVPFMPPAWFINRGAQARSSFLPSGQMSRNWFLKTHDSIDKLLSNKSSILYGENPNESTVPVYAHVTECKTPGHFHVTYWLFFPYNRGKEVCTMSIGMMGLLPIPRWLNGQCLGMMKEFGNHVGDWEHVSLYFKGEKHPSEMYLSVHNFGNYYKFDNKKKQFILQGQIHMNQLKFPKVVNLTEGSHPVLFAAKGSHGLWAKPGNHRYIRIPSLYDDSGYGIKWNTWKSIQVFRDFNTNWLRFQGRWGNPRENCLPLSSIICQLVDGPTGIPMKKHHFSC